MIIQFKSILLVGTTLLVSSCSTNKPEGTFPGEFIGADYILSDENAQRWAVASRQAEQCVYPNLTKIQQQHFSQQDAYLHAQYVLFYPLEKIIGEEYVKIIQEDEKSMGYAQLQFKKYKNVEVKPLDKAECLKLRKEAKDDLAVLKGEYKNGMVNEAPVGDNKNPDGVATNENKFFFDIIKWGAALLL